MMKYRRLTTDEVDGLKQEFVHYLAQQGIPAEDWARRLVTNEGVEEHLDGFSEYFFDRATAAITFLERQDGDTTWLFSFGEREASLIRLQVDNHGQGQIAGTGQKTFEPEARGREIFLLLEQGAQPSKGEKFEAAQATLNQSGSENPR